MPGHCKSSDVRVPPQNFNLFLHGKEYKTKLLGGDLNARLEMTGGGSE